MKLTGSKIFGASGLIALVVLGGCGKPGGGAIATVNGEAISQQEYMDYLEHKANMLVMTPQGPTPAQVWETPGFQALKDLIVNKIIEQMAKDDGVYPSDADLAKELDFQKQQNQNLVQDAMGRGITMDMLKEDFRVQLCKFNIITKGITVKPEEVDAFIKDNPTTFETPPQVQALMVLVKTDQAKTAVDAALNQGKQFAEVAQQFSADETGRQSGYRYNQTDESKMPKPLQALFNKTPVLHTTDWVKATEGFVKFYIQKKSPAAPIAITPAIREQVKRQLMLQRGSQAVDLNKRIQDKLNQSKDGIKIVKQEDEKPWELFARQMAQNINVSPTVSGSPGGAAQVPGAAPSGTAGGGAPATAGAATAGGAAAPPTKTGN